MNISSAILSEILIQISYFAKSYARKQKWMFFWTQCTYTVNDVDYMTYRLSAYNVICNYYVIQMQCILCK